MFFFGADFMTQGAIPRNSEKWDILEAKITFADRSEGPSMAKISTVFADRSGAEKGNK